MAEGPDVTLAPIGSVRRTQVGRDTLARWLAAPGTPAELGPRQAAVGELRGLFDWREQLTLTGSEVPQGAAAFEARLDVVEPMGMETMVYFIVDGVEVCGRVNPAAAGSVGEAMRLVADLNQMHLIDPRSGLVV